MEITKLPIAELRRLKVRIETEIARRTDTTKRDLLKKMQKMATEAGLSLDDLIGNPAASAETKRAKRGEKKASPVKTKGKVAPKYQNPDDASQLWTGRGRKPAWVAAWVNAKKPIEGLLIKKN